MVVSSTMIWKGMMVVTGSESPIVVVLGGSMEPAFTNYEEEEIMVGEIVVFKPSSNILAVGTAAQQLDTSYSTNSNLEIYGLTLSESGHYIRGKDSTKLSIGRLRDGRGYNVQHQRADWGIKALCTMMPS